MTIYRITEPPTHGDIKILKDYPKVIGVDPRASGLRIIEYPLSETPSAVWIECLKNPGILITSFHGTEVRGATVRIRADAEHPEHDLDSLQQYIEKANECYRKRVQEIEKVRERQAETERKQQDQNREIEKRLRGK